MAVASSANRGQTSIWLEGERERGRPGGRVWDARNAYARAVARRLGDAREWKRARGRRVGDDGPRRSGHARRVERPFSRDLIHREAARCGAGTRVRNAARVERSLHAAALAPAAVQRYVAGVDTSRKRVEIVVVQDNWDDL